MWSNILFMNGYIQILINGKNIGLKFNMYAAENLSNIKGNPTTSANIVRMVWAGVLGNSFVKQIDPEVTFEDVADWVEDLTLNGDKEGILQKVSDTFLGSQPVQKLIEKGTEELAEDEKKN